MTTTGASIFGHKPHKLLGSASFDQSHIHTQSYGSFNLGERVRVLWNTASKSFANHLPELLFFSRKAVSKSLRPHGLQHTSLHCPSPSPGVCSNSCPLSWWCHPAISSPVTLFSFCLQSFLPSGSFPMSQLFTSCGQSTRASASASILPNNIQGWFPLGSTGLISLLSKGLSRVFCSIPGYPVLHCLLEFAQTHVHWCHPNISSSLPLLLLPSIFPSIRVFSNESALSWVTVATTFIRWPKY